MLIAIGIIILLFFVYGYQKSFKHTLILYLVFKIFIIETFNLLDIPGIPLITLDRCLIILTIIFYGFNKSSIIRKTAWKNYPLKKPILFVTISYVATMLFSGKAISSNLFFIVATIFDSFIILFIIWDTLDKYDIEKYFKYLIVSIIIFTTYGIINALINTNPWIELLKSGQDSDSRNIINVYSADYEIGRGNRIQSFFHHPIAFGGFISIIFIIVIGLLNKKEIVKKNTAFICIILLILNVFLTFSRSPIFSLFLSILIYIILGKYIFRLWPYVVFLLIIFIIVIMQTILGESFSDLIYSTIFIFKEDSITSGLGGSSIELRFVQFATAYELMSDNFIFGYGLTFVRDMIIQKESFALYGVESFLLKTMLNTGLVGFLAYTYLFITIMKKYKALKSGQKPASQMSLINAGISSLIGFVILISITGDLGLIPYFLLLHTILLKYLWKECK